MKTIRSIGFASIAGAALAILSPLSIADANQDQANSGNTVHRVSHALAANQKYTGGTNSGYKWGQKSRAVESKATWSEASETRSGYKWGQSSAPSAAQPGVAGFAEQSANRWKRRSSTEQAANRWKRRSFAEQSANRWKRRSSTEQAANRWKRRSFAEQSANRWKRRSSAEQAANRWKRRSFAEQSANRWKRR